MSAPQTVVITGAAGSSGRLLAVRLASCGYRVHAVDRQHATGLPEGVTFHRIDVRKRGFEDVLRKLDDFALIHLARLHRFEADAAERHRVNFEGTVRVFDIATAARAKKLVFPSRHTVYGALPDQPQFLTEEHPPAAGRTYPEIQDLVSADLYASGQLWRHPEVEIVVLRPVNIVGPSVDNLFCRYLGHARVFSVAGFDPLYQVLHEDDFARALELSLEPGVRGVFNVVGPEPVPLHVVIEESGARRVAVPEPLIRLLGGRAGFARVPRGAIDYLKYPCTVDGSAFAEATGYAPSVGLEQTLRSMRGRPRAA